MSATWKAKRRAFAVITAAALALTACGSSGESDSDESGSTAAAGEIDRDAILRFTSAGPIPQLDPALQPSYGMQGYVALIYDRLTMIDAEDNVVPGLATEWEFAEDGSYLELTLRDDVEFHDGTPFDAEAVRANIERGKTLEGSTVSSSLESITEVEIVEPTVVRLHLAEGAGVQLPSVLATNVGMMISPAAIADPSIDLATDPGDAGSGAYLVSEFVPNEKLVLERAEGKYWDPDAALVAGMELLRVPEASTRLNGVQTGQTDLSFISSPNDLVQAAQLADQGQLNYETTPARNITGVYLRADQGALTQPEVRQAMAHAIDPDAVNALFSGNCTPARQLYPKGNWPYMEDYEYPYEYDQDAARELVESVGGASVTLSFAAGTNADQLANVVQGQLTEVGFDAQLNPVPNSESEARFIAGEFESLPATSWSPSIDPADTVSKYLLNRYSLAVEPAKSEIAEVAQQAADPTLAQEERAELYSQIWQTTLEEVWFIPICQSTFGAIFNDRVVNVDNVPWVNIGIWDLRYVGMTSAD
jgi:peptide/nickel transport system substrate-binding protein